MTDQKVEQKLRDLYCKCDIHKSMADYLESLGLYRMDDFATLIDNRERVQSQILDNVERKREDRQLMFRLKQAWRVANND
jgi:hypothetical protein